VIINAMYVHLKEFVLDARKIEYTLPIVFVREFLKKKMGIVYRIP
jgi:hypothetical protein